MYIAPERGAVQGTSYKRYDVQGHRLVYFALTTAVRVHTCMMYCTGTRATGSSIALD